jgi:hypothetical protein
MYHAAKTGDPAPTPTPTTQTPTPTTQTPTPTPRPEKANRAVIELGTKRTFLD